MADIGLLLVNGGLMRGQWAHARLVGSTFLEEVRTARAYRLFSIEDRYPAMFRDDLVGRSIAGELYELPHELWAAVRDAEPPGLYRGEVELNDGRVVPGILGVRTFALEHGVEITSYGGWRAYLASKGGEGVRKE